MIPTQILLVDDSLADANLLAEALRRCGWDHVLTQLRDGAEALDYLKRREPYRLAVPPDLILLDLNLPRVSGLEVIAEVRWDSTLARIPLYLLSGSDWELGDTRRLGIPRERYLIKPMAFQGYLALAQHFMGLFTAHSA